VHEHDFEPAVDGWRTALRVWRGDYIENRHVAHVAVVTSDGRLVAAFNDADRRTLVRSTAKPAQALAVLQSAPNVAQQLSSADLALLCASHSAEPQHLRNARNLMERFGVTEADLVCGGHPSLSAAVNRDWILKGFEPGPVCSNCSGKHIGMAAAALEMTGSAACYQDSEHPLQRRVRTVLADLVDLPSDQIGWAVDGCNLPTPVLPLSRLARLYALIAAAAGAASLGGARSLRDEQLARLYEGMTTHPHLVAGEGRFCTRLMRAAQGALIGKVGADGVYAVGLRAHAGRPALGVAVKVEDGSVAALETVVCAVLRSLRAMPEGLDDLEHPRLVNTAGRVVGRMESMLALEET
jgi:L-asparaginase II